MNGIKGLRANVSEWAIDGWEHELQMVDWYLNKVYKYNVSNLVRAMIKAIAYHIVIRLIG